MANFRPQTIGDPAKDEVPWLFTQLGVAYALTIVGDWVLFVDSLPEFLLDAHHFVMFVTGLPIIAGLLYSGHYITESEISENRYYRIAGWCFGGLVVVLAVTVAVGFALSPRHSLLRWLRWTTLVGSGVGLLIGVIEARAIDRELAVERETARAEYIESQRQLLDYLNGLLRHEVLNTANVIHGHAGFLADGDDRADSIAVIQRQTESLTRVIEDVQMLLKATRGETEIGRRDLAAVLETEAEMIREAHGNARVELSVEDELTVAGDELLPRLFSNLLANAVEHNDSEEPHASVTAERVGDAVRVRISDNGPGIPESEIEGLFERKSSTGNHGLGLYLVRTLVERYGGTIELTETGDDGTVFTVELPTGPESADVTLPETGLTREEVAVSDERIASVGSD